MLCRRSRCVARVRRITRVVTISGVGMMAKMTAAGRAPESRRPDRLFDDPLAQALAGEDGFRWMEEMRPPGAPAANPSIGPRTWFFDQLITRAAADGFRQVVLLAAGMDTRAFRPPAMGGE
jgi:methyltransferase (TIGR00027 family)